MGHSATRQTCLANSMRSTAQPRFTSRSRLWQAYAWVQTVRCTRGDATKACSSLETASTARAAQRRVECRRVWWRAFARQSSGTPALAKAMARR